MTVRIEVPARLEDWAARAGYTLTLQSDGRAEFWSRGGEVRYLIGARDDGWFVITSSDRLGPEYLTLAAPSKQTIERYFFGMFGGYIRSEQGLPRVRVPRTREEISAGLALDTRMFDGTERLALIGDSGDVVAVSSGDEISGTSDLAELSLYLTASIDDIAASSLDPEGKPLFRPR